MGLFEGHRCGFVILNVILGINFLLHNTSQLSEAEGLFVVEGVYETLRRVMVRSVSLH